MRAVVCHQAELTVQDLPDLSPSAGQLLLAVERCGICGSDLHARTHCDETAADVAELGYDAFMRSTDHVVMGHEFVGTVLDHGSRTSRRQFPVGSRVVALPVGEAFYTSLATDKDGALYYVRAVQPGGTDDEDFDAPQADAELMRFDFEERESESLARGARPRVSSLRS